jgi:hypothetical protein
MGVRFPRRLTDDDARLSWLARGISWRAPHPDEVLHPEPFVPPTPDPPPAGAGEGDWLRWLEHWSAEDVVFEGGVPVACSLAGRAFLSLGVWLFRHAPLRAVRLVAIAPFVGELAVCPHVAKLRRLDLSGNWIGGDGAKLLAASPAFAELAELDLTGNDLTAVEVEAVRKLFPGRVLLR